MWRADHGRHAWPGGFAPSGLTIEGSTGDCPESVRGKKNG
jgi:hypothetical protein